MSDILARNLLSVLKRTLGYLNGEDLPRDLVEDYPRSSPNVTMRAYLEHIVAKAVITLDEHEDLRRWGEQPTHVPSSERSEIPRKWLDEPDDPTPLATAPAADDETLERLIDTHGLDGVLDLMAEVCYNKAHHASSNWQDAELARAWERAANRVERCSDSRPVQAVS